VRDGREPAPEKYGLTLAVVRKSFFKRGTLSSVVSAQRSHLPERADPSEKIAINGNWKPLLATNFITASRFLRSCSRASASAPSTLRRSRRAVRRRPSISAERHPMQHQNCHECRAHLQRDHRTAARVTRPRKGDWILLRQLHQPLSVLNSALHTKPVSNASEVSARSSMLIISFRRALSRPSLVRRV